MINYGDGLHPALDTITRITPNLARSRQQAHDLHSWHLRVSEPAFGDTGAVSSGTRVMR
jgi:hypothetical protein